MAATSNLSREEVRRAVESVRPTIEQHRDQAEKERSLPAAVIAAMRQEGLFDLWLPKEYGGAEVDLLTYLATIEELSRIDSAAGWVFTIIATSAAQAAFLPEVGAREVYGNKPLTAGSVVPRGRAVPVDGGFRVTGRWPLASGCQHVSWLAGNCLIFDGDTPRIGPHNVPDFTLVYVPAEDCTILDTWHSTGMRGTGSHDFTVDEVFVPEQRTFPLFTAQPHVSGSLYKIRLEMFFLTAIATVSLGIARASIDAFVDLANDKTPTLSQTRLASRPTIHAEVARTEALYQSARAYLHEVAGEIMTTVSEGDAVSEPVEVRRRLATMHVAEACEEVVDRMYRLGGSTSIYTGNQLDRCLRDIHTVNQHLAVSPVWWEKTGQYYFGQGLGMP